MSAGGNARVKRRSTSNWYAADAKRKIFRPQRQGTRRRGKIRNSILFGVGTDNDVPDTAVRDLENTGITGKFRPKMKAYVEGTPFIREVTEQ